MAPVNSSYLVILFILVMHYMIYVYRMCNTYIRRVSLATGSCSAGIIFSRSCSLQSSRNYSSDSSRLMNSRQRYSAKKRRVMEKFGDDEHKSSLERHDRKEREENNRIEREENNRHSLNVTV